MPVGLIGIERQAEVIAERWPLFRPVAGKGRRAMWEGPLEPMQRRFRVRISYEVPYAIENFSVINVQPRVQVVNPLLEWHPEYEDGPVPHVYHNRKEPRLPFLCLFDPYNLEWSPSDLLAETTIPWTARYLYFYEGWLLTGRWLGGGRHPTQAERDGDDAKAIAAV